MTMKKLLSDTQIDEALDALCTSVLDDMPDGPVAVVGIRTRGETLARRFVARLAELQPDRQVDLGVLDITFYRDDLSQRRGVPLVKATEIDFDIDETWLVLIDDVLHTGRSVRAALDALHDYGRPSVIRLAVLIDRGGRELPIAADYVGTKLAADDDQRIQLKLEENDGQEGAYLIKRKT